MIRRSLALSLLTLLGPVAGHAHPKPVPQGKPSKALHVVRSGETLSALAKRYGVSVTALAKTNGLASPDSIRAGQKLLIPEFHDRAPRFRWPVDGPVNSRFGWRGAHRHAGIDIMAKAGERQSSPRRPERFIIAGGKVVTAASSRFSMPMDSSPCMLTTSSCSSMSGTKCTRVN